MMNQKILKHTILILSGLFIIPTSVIANPATLSKELQLHIPVITFENQGQTQYLSADLTYQPTNNPETPAFQVFKYSILSADNIPPVLRDLKLVTEGAPPEIVDLTATNARLTFISSIPLACSVVYGKTPNFGKIATDINMNGSAIINHNPILNGLEKNTQYYYRVQGSDAAGKIYWAPTATFKTSAASITDNNLLSLKNGATVTAVSSNFSGAKNNQTWGANSAIDGSNATAWSSAGDGDNAFIEITLAASKNIETIEVFSRSMNDGSAKIISFTVTTDSGEKRGPFTLPNTTQAHQFPLNRQTKSIRFEVETSTGGNTGLFEIRAYETSPSRTSGM
jgi:hypothetical protein